MIQRWLRPSSPLPRAVVAHWHSRRGAASRVDMPVPPPLTGLQSPTVADTLPDTPIPTLESHAPSLQSPVDEIAERMEAIANMSQEEFDARYKAFNERETKRARAAIRDDVFQMSVSEKKAVGRLKVFWKKVEVVPAAEGWFNVTLDGRRVKALESDDTLFLPSEALAYAVAKEWSDQKGDIQKLLMPMNDVASGSQAIDEYSVHARLEHLLTFLGSDNMYFRHPQLKQVEEQLCDPICDWFDQHYGVKTPRITGLCSTKIADITREKVHQALVDMDMNKYQVVCLYVITQYTASLVLALALVNGVVDLPTALQINRLEEMHSVNTSVPIDGYHDIRDADVTIK
eukprot:EG_transcript_18536